MAKTNRQNRRRRAHHPIVTVLIIILLIGISLFVSKSLADRVSDDSINNIKDESSNTTKTEETEKAPIKDNSTSTEDGDNKTPVQNDGEDPNNKEFLTGVITMSEVSNGTLHIRVNIDQYLSSGTCSLSLYTDNNKSFSDSADIIPAASTSTCEGFDIPASSLSSGHWYINIDLESTDKTGTITGEVNI